MAHFTPSKEGADRSADRERARASFAREWSYLAALLVALLGACSPGPGKFAPRSIVIRFEALPESEQSLSATALEAEVYQDKHGLSGVALTLDEGSIFELHQRMQSGSQGGPRVEMDGEILGELAGYNQESGKVFLETQLRIRPVNELYRRFLAP